MVSYVADLSSEIFYNYLIHWQSLSCHFSKMLSCPTSELDEYCRSVWQCNSVDISEDLSLANFL